ncbi:hypothetical protein BDA99DRAFT_541791 [Phascolomyces articulosus]|uniref:Uncharacterized protein n=1 Tax=Phascolomyces articulosus TaxID=60185 RepID=A0AAD5K4K1_9FUNG|nr:hypothetical protein BDA99DRAFT_541791 [Phascolomyces articulosus]
MQNLTEAEQMQTTRKTFINGFNVRYSLIWFLYNPYLKILNEDEDEDDDNNVYLNSPSRPRDVKDNNHCAAIDNLELSPLEKSDVLTICLYVLFFRIEWSLNIKAPSKNSITFITIINHLLTYFHLLSHHHQKPFSSHQKILFVEKYTFPNLLPLAKVTNLLSFHWCEFEIQAMKDVHMVDNNFNLLKTPKRYPDALGKMKILLDMEIVIVEASRKKEYATKSNCSFLALVVVWQKMLILLSIEDSSKTLEYSTVSLISQAFYKIHKSFDQKFQETKKVISIQVIKNKTTISATMSCLQECNRTEAQLNDEHLGCCDATSLTVEEYLVANSPNPFKFYSLPCYRNAKLPTRNLKKHEYRCFNANLKGSTQLLRDTRFAITGQTLITIFSKLGIPWKVVNKTQFLS